MLQGSIRNFSLALALFAGAAAWGQDTGVLTGTVTDSSGAVVVNAQVTAVNVATNFETTTVTNEEGLYRAVNLRPTAALRSRFHVRQTLLPGRYPESGRRPSVGYRGSEELDRCQR